MREISSPLGHTFIRDESELTGRKAKLQTKHLEKPRSPRASSAPPLRSRLNRGFSGTGHKHYASSANARSRAGVARRRDPSRQPVESARFQHGAQRSMPRPSTNTRTNEHHRDTTTESDEEESRQTSLTTQGSNPQRGETTARDAVCPRTLLRSLTASIFITTTYWYRCNTIHSIHPKRKAVGGISLIPRRSRGRCSR